MRRTAVALTIALCSIANAKAQNIDDHLQVCISDRDCEIDQKQFVKWFPLAYKRDYQGQRNVAFCLADGCSGAVKKNAVLSCAWRTVILASGSPRVEDIDRQSFNNTCGKLDLADRVTARMQANELSNKIYKRPIPMEYEAILNTVRSR